MKEGGASCERGPEVWWRSSPSLRPSSPPQLGVFLLSAVIEFPRQSEACHYTHVADTLHTLSCSLLRLRELEVDTDWFLSDRVRGFPLTGLDLTPETVQFCLIPHAKVLLGVIWRITLSLSVCSLCGVSAAACWLFFLQQWIKPNCLQRFDAVLGPRVSWTLHLVYELVSDEGLHLFTKQHIKTSVVAFLISQTSWCVKSRWNNRISSYKYWKSSLKLTYVKLYFCCVAEDPSFYDKNYQKIRAAQWINIF